MRHLARCNRDPVATVSAVSVRGRRQRWAKGWSRAAGPPRGHWSPLWAVIPPLQVVLSSACSVASLGRFPSHYLPGRPSLRQGVLAAHLFGWGIPSTQQAGHVTVHSASSAKSPCGVQGGMTLPNKGHVSAKPIAQTKCFHCVLLGRGPHKNCKNDLDDQT